MPKVKRYTSFESLKTANISSGKKKIAKADDKELKALMDLLRSTLVAREKL